MGQPNAVAIAPLLISIPAAATALGVGRTTIYTLTNSGKLESVQVGRRRMIPEAAIREYVAQLRADLKATQQVDRED